MREETPQELRARIDAEVAKMPRTEPTCSHHYVMSVPVPLFINGKESGAVRDLIVELRGDLWSIHAQPTGVYIETGDDDEDVR